MLSESGEVIPVYINKGYSKKLEFDLWDQFVPVITKLMKEMDPMSSDDQKRNIMGKFLPAFTMQVNGKLGLDLNQEAVADILKLPMAEIANTNVWELMQGFSAWGTTDDMELIHQVDEGDPDVNPIWCKVPGHKNFKTQNEAINAFFKMYLPFF